MFVMIICPFREVPIGVDFLCKLTIFSVKKE
jgi:hypothetical protein